MKNDRYRAGQIDTLLQTIREGQLETHQKLDAIMDRQLQAEISLARLTERVDDNDEDIRHLQASDRKWGFLSALVGVVSATVGSVIAGSKG